MITVKQCARMLKVTDGRVRQLLMERRIVGAKKFGHAWMIPERVVIKAPAKPRGRPRKGGAS